MRKTIWIFLLPAAALAQSMLADIQKPVETPFGIYRPRMVTVVPNAENCDPGPNLQYVVNLADFSFSPEQLQKLKENGFVVTPALRGNRCGYNEMFDLYTDCRENGIPQFITSDVMLHGFHLMFDRILKACEEQRLIAQLDALLEGVAEKTRAQYEAATDPSVREALFRNLDYLLVASQLLTPKQFFADPLPGGRWSEEVALILDAAAAFVPSPIFGYPEDYTQYKPRGHYTRSEELQRYFRCMMWLGRMTFSCEKDEAYERSMTLSAVLLVQALIQARVDGRSGVDVWEDLYQPTVFFVGKSDDIHYQPYRELAYSIYGKSFPIYPPDTFADEEKLRLFLQEIGKIAPAQITYEGQPKKGFRFMGQRFVPDSWILDELVYSKLRNRFMPTGLDVMIVLGPYKRAREEPAFRHLPANDQSNGLYIAKLDTLKKIFGSYDDTVWAQNLYWNWLYCLMPLLMPKGDGYPFFMRGEAWRDKDLHAALASWAELRHDTILYVKQSGTERGGVPPSALQVQGYVEPNPYLFARLAALAEFMIDGLKSRDLLFAEFRDHLAAFGELADNLADIAEKELSRRRLSSEDYQLIFDFGKAFYNIVTFQPSMISEGPPCFGEAPEPLPIIADVHTDANSGLVLEEGVGFPYAVYVICSIEGRPTIAKGAGFSYFEFTHPMNDRLTDEQWRKMLTAETSPQPPRWIGSFFSASEKQKAAESLAWEKPVSTTVRLELPERVEIGTPFTLSVSLLNDWDNSAPLATLLPPTGEPVALPLTRDGSAWSAVVPTLNLTPGTAFIHIEKHGSGQRLFYRSHLQIAPSTAVKADPSPLGFQLVQNYPNPFNGNTIFLLSLSEQSQVRFELFDLRGRFIAILVDQVLPSGVHRIVWDGRDRQGRIVPNGVYLCRTIINDKVEITRMVVAR
ncbi:MAG: DUF3160 domain-containing protein [candidate division KSB1 bacterium]|nr:DUF3160 domain-containing protein [candidate division KSB1 bacterium]